VQTSADTERPRVTVATLYEKALRQYLSKTAAVKVAHLTQRLRYANMLSCDALAAAMTTGVAGRSPFANIHEKAPRQLSRNEISQKTTAAFDQVYDLAQTEILAEENQARGAMYETLAKLAEVNGALLMDASHEEVLEEVIALRHVGGS
jgi:hypothetical protein